MEQHNRVLIVDDNPMNVDVLRRILRKEYQLATAASGDECLARLSEAAPQLVLLDIMMPGLDGYETCRRIKTGPLGDSVQVILVSGKGTAADRVRGYEALADDYIVKPFDHEELLSKVRAHFRLRRLRVDAGQHEAIARLHRLINQMSIDIGEHCSLIEKIQKELSVSGESSPDALIEAMVRLADTNQATQTRLALAERKLREEAREIEIHASEARTDALTLLPNRRAFDEALTRHWGEAGHLGKTLCAVMFDIDCFKQLNDQHGHLAGDLVLQTIGRILGQAMRSSDFVARYGGDEFAALLLVDSCLDAQKSVDQIRERIAGEAVKLENRSLRVTISAGVAERLPGEDETAWIKRADEALYSAKKAGRNQTHWHDAQQPRPFVPQGEWARGPVQFKPGMCPTVASSLS